MIRRTVTTSSPVRTSVTRIGGTHTVVSPGRHVSTTVHRPSTTIISSPVRRSVTVTSPLRAQTTVTTTNVGMSRARPVVDTFGLTRSIAVVRGALPNARTYGRPVEMNDTGVTSPVKPTSITRLPAGPTQTFIHTSPMRQTITYANPVETTVTQNVPTTTTVTRSHIPTSPIRVTRHAPTTTVTRTHASPVRVTTIAPTTETTTRHYSPTRVTATTMSPGRVVTHSRVSPGRTITEHAPRFVGSTNLATSTYIPAPTTTVTTTQVPATTVTTTQVPTTTVTTVPLGTTATTGAITGNTYVSRMYSPTRRVAALQTSPSRVRIDNVGVH